MKKYIALALCFFLSVGPAFATTQATGSSATTTSGKTSGTSASTTTQCTSNSTNDPCGPTNFPLGPGAGRSPDGCSNAATALQEKNKLAEEAAAGIGKAAEEQANNETDSIMDQLMNCISALNANVLGGLDDGLSWESILNALKNAVCKFAKEKTREIWQEGLAQMTFDVGGRSFNIQNVDLLGVNIASAGVGDKWGSYGKGKAPILVSRTPTVNNAAYRMFKGSSSFNAGLAGTATPGTGNEFVDDFLSMSLEEIMKGGN